MQSVDSLIRSFHECYADDPDEPNHRLITTKEVCPECHGEGQHCNRAIDGNGITQSDREDWADDDFMDGYMRGDYDVPCQECHGRNVIDVVDENATDPAALEAWNDWIQSYYETESVYAMERAMGA
jgi:hypothetical protein